MYNKSYGHKKSGGFRDDRRGGGRDWKPMFPATCEQCGNRCEVPFKPNGRKPVYCSNCFVKDDRGGKSFDKPRFDRPMSSGPDVSAQLKAINDKLDAIIDALSE
jgi:CxxC-x17-CxxC domain-containing protein